MNPVKMRVPPPKIAAGYSRNMLKERIFIHPRRIPLRLKTRYQSGEGAA
jgi:hypothetical protein